VKNTARFEILLKRMWFELLKYVNGQP